MVSQHVGTGSFNSAFRFNAKEYDEETGNYYYGARYYEPKSSVWMGVDALATSYPGMNPYNFVMGNPIMAMDPDGNESDICETCPEDAKYDRFRNNLRLKWDYDAESGGLIRDHSYVPPFDFGDGYETMAPSHSISEAKKPLATKYKESIVGGSNVSKYLIYPIVESVYIAAQSLFTPNPRNLEGYFVSPKEKLDAGINALLVASPAVKSIGLLDDAAKTSGAGKYLFNNWHKGTFANRTQSVSYHLAKHGKGRTATQYTQDAMNFFNKNKGLGQNVILKDGTQGIKIQTKQIINGKTHRVGGYWTRDGKLVTFWD
jgi:RHS repeat-associated protein